MVMLEMKTHIQEMTACDQHKISQYNANFTKINMEKQNRIEDLRSLQI